MAKSFIEGIKTKIDGLIEVVEGASYLPWATSLALADRPPLETVVFESQRDPFLAFFGGYVVACEAPGGVRVYLPVLDKRHNPIGPDRVDSTEIVETGKRAMAKCIALNHGVGLCLHAGYDSPAGFLKALGLTPDSDLAKVEPLTDNKPNQARAPYVKWAAAYTAAKLTDPGFVFQVEWFDNVDPATGEVRALPVKPMPGGSWAVAVTITYRGATRTEWLTIMGFGTVQTKNGPKKLDHQPLTNPTVADWNRAVMRCLAKAIASETGYGLSVYAGDAIEELHREPSARHVEQASASATDTAAPETPNAAVEPPAPQVPADSSQEPGQLSKSAEGFLRRIESMAMLEHAELARSHAASKYSGYDLEVLNRAIDARESQLRAQAKDLKVR